MNAATRRILSYTVAALVVAGLVVFSLVSVVGFPPAEQVPFELSGRAYFFDHPEAFYIAALIPLFVLLHGLGMARWSLPQTIVQLILRSSLVLALATALASPTTTDTEVEICAAYIIDHSASVSAEWTEAARDFIAQSLAEGSTFERHVFAFAEEAVELSAGPDGRPNMPALSPNERLGTNIEAALQRAASACPASATRRVLLLSDGQETDGDMFRAAANLAQAGVEVSTVALDVPPRPESFIAGVDFPDEIDVSEPFRITLDIFSSIETNATLRTTQNEIREPTRELNLTPGSNKVTLESEVPMPGLRRYSFSLRTEGEDHFSENNEWNEQVRVEGRPQVLYIEGESRARHYLQRAIDRDRNDLANFDLEVRGAWSVPQSLEEMENYDVIILSDVSSDYVSDRTARQFERYVRQMGGGLILVGGEDSFGPGGYVDSKLEDISPVAFEMERGREEPSLAMLLVMDRSGSMRGTKLEMAKDAASAVVDLLSSQDFVGVISFDSEAQTNVRLQKVSARNRIRNAIGRIAPGGGTDIYPALEEAYLQLLAQPAQMHHVILLTDGQAPWEGISELASSMRADDMTVSTVGVGSQADRSLLQMIAELGSGRFYATSDPGSIPRIFVQEAARVSRSAFVEEPVRARPVARAAALRGIAWDSSPYLLGYVKTQLKPGATLLLRSDRGDPILARWRLGLGQVVAFTSDVKNRWAVEWVRSSIYPQFWAQLIRDTMRVQEESPWSIETTTEGSGVRLQVDALRPDGTFINGATVTAVLQSPSNEQVTVELPQVAPGRYEAFAEVSEYGTFEVQASVAGVEESETAPTTSFTRPFPNEYQAIGVQERSLQRVADVGDGAYNPAAESIWNTEGAEQTVYESHWHWPAMAALIILFFDILFRRIRLFSAPARSWDAVTSYKGDSI
jgi:uncharacterized membrane protein/uncharacterized protein YegL